MRVSRRVFDFGLEFSSIYVTAVFALDGGPNAVDGPVAVTVSTNGRPSNDDKTFFHRVARHLLPLNASVAPNSIAPLQTPVDGDLLYFSGQVKFHHFCGVGRNYLFSLTDQENQEITNRPFAFNEVFSNYTGSWTIATFTPGSILLGEEVADIQSRGVVGQGCLQWRQE